MLVISSALLLLVASVSSAPPVAEDSENLQVALRGLLTPNSSGSGVVVLPPALSVDIVSLLRWVMHAEMGAAAAGQVARVSQGDVTSREAAVTTKPENHQPSRYYDTSKLNLVELGGKMYFLSKSQKLEWPDAASFCRMYGMDLASVESKRENDLIANHIHELGLTPDIVFISGNKIGRSSFLWLTGETIIYENWKSGEPDNAEYSCMCYHQRQWWDYPCTSVGTTDYKKSFLCEERTP